MKTWQRNRKARKSLKKARKNGRHDTKSRGCTIRVQNRSKILTKQGKNHFRFDGSHGNRQRTVDSNSVPPQLSVSVAKPRRRRGKQLRVQTPSWLLTGNVYFICSTPKLSAFIEKADHQVDKAEAKLLLVYDRRHGNISLTIDFYSLAPSCLNPLKKIRLLTKKLP